MFNPDVHSHQHHKFMNHTYAEIYALDALVFAALFHYRVESANLPDGEDRDEARALMKMAEHFKCFTGSELSRREEAAAKGKIDFLTQEEKYIILETGTTSPEQDLSWDKDMTFDEYQAYRLNLHRCVNGQLADKE